jgi:hypothetical protein
MKRHEFAAHMRGSFLLWAQKKGYTVGSSGKGLEAFRIMNRKKGEILIGQFHMLDPKIITTSGRLSRLVEEWKDTVASAAGDVLK